MRSFPGKLSLIAATLSLAGLALTGCSGDSSSSDDDDSTTTTSLSCSTQVSMADDGGGLTSNAGYQGLHYYALGGQLCAFDPLAGTGFEVDRVSADTIAPAATIFTQGSTSDLSVRGLVYPRGNELYFAEAGAQSASAPPSPRQVSSESNADEIDMIMTGFDKDDSDGASIAYRIPDFDDSSTAWFSARLSDSSAVDPTAFSEFQRPMGPVNDSSGALEGWLAHHFETDNSGVVRDAFVLVSATDASQELQGLQGNLDSPLGTNVNYRVQLDNGDVALTVSRSGQTEFYYLNADTNDITSVGTIDAEVGGFSTAYSTNGDALYFGQTIQDGGGGPDDEARLYRVDGDEVALLDSADVADTFPVQVTATNSGVVWAWNSAMSDTGPAGVYLVDDGATPANVTPIIENDDASNEFTFSSMVLGTGGNTVFFTERNTSTGSDLTAYAVDTATTTATDPGFVVEVPNADWVSSSQPEDSPARAGVVPPPRMSEVFLVENDGGTLRLSAYDAGTPSESVVLGTLSVDFNLPAGIPVSPIVTSFGLGPYRLMYLAKNNDELFIVDTRHENSLRNLAVQQDGSPSFRTFEGF